ncbi:VOC family protein [Cohnella soli]|uniref:VOC family protein n=1 Tax=Cohnella soli TaxID=425005 RepID=A0ABW0HSW2_9BACL
MNYEFEGIDHVQLAAPEGCEQKARNFFAGVLGWEEIPKPEILARRGGAWFQCGSQQVHIGVQSKFVPAKKAHPAFLVRNLDRLREHLQQNGIPIVNDDARGGEGIDRFYVDDPFGNRLEFMESAAEHPSTIP